jgi:hypothetical protein
MKKQLQKVISLTLYLFLLGTEFGYSQAAINTVYVSYIRPILVSIVVLVFIVTALININEFRKGGDAQKDAFINCIIMAVYPGVVLALAEAVKAIMAMFTAGL